MDFRGEVMPNELLIGRTLNWTPSTAPGWLHGRNPRNPAKRIREQQLKKLAF